MPRPRVISCESLRAIELWGGGARCTASHEQSTARQAWTTAKHAKVYFHHNGIRTSLVTSERIEPVEEAARSGDILRSTRNHRLDARGNLIEIISAIRHLAILPTEAFRPRY